MFSRKVRDVAPERQLKSVKVRRSQRSRARLTAFQSSSFLRSLFGAPQKELVISAPSLVSSGMPREPGTGWRTLQTANSSDFSPRAIPPPLVLDTSTPLLSQLSPSESPSTARTMSSFPSSPMAPSFSSSSHTSTTPPTPVTPLSGRRPSIPHRLSEPGRRKPVPKYLAEDESDPHLAAEDEDADEASLFLARGEAEGFQLGSNQREDHLADIYRSTRSDSIASTCTTSSSLYSDGSREHDSNEYSSRGRPISLSPFYLETEDRDFPLPRQTILDAPTRRSVDAAMRPSFPSLEQYHLPALSFPAATSGRLPRAHQRTASIYLSPSAIIGSSVAELDEGEDEEQDILDFYRD